MKSKVRATPAVLFIMMVTSVVTIVQFWQPQVLEWLRRDPSALAEGEWWRVVTPLLVHSDGWGQFLFNMLCLAIFGFAAERQFGSGRVLLLYLAGGLAGEAAGYAWEPMGAGASVGFCGILGGLLVFAVLRKNNVHPILASAMLFCLTALVGGAAGKLWLILLLFGLLILLQIMLMRNGSESNRAVITGAAGLLASAALVWLHDIHGVAVLAGAIAALTFLPVPGRK